MSSNKINNRVNIVNTLNKISNSGYKWVVKWANTIRYNSVIENCYTAVTHRERRERKAGEIRLEKAAKNLSGNDINHHCAE